jgi:hypothetical protein
VVVVVLGGGSVVVGVRGSFGRRTIGPDFAHGLKDGSKAPVIEFGHQ